MNRNTRGCACRLCQEMREHEAATQRSHRASGAGSHSEQEQVLLGKRKTIRPDAYFSDEDASDED